ncbi:ribonuclease P protein component [Lacihabitans sp. LS3-19]|uniref:ribonuclease P protein component n=1 Tax=Lacihabitans sp. LS3-19 TaxID=2487335 RepID=UPI0020CBBE4B|nr:ribonuclease P protein component [Lacihabitans sp. LS3-19]MCP9770338.1 ribonuclease P protein component [Lacihabitans sp. LS3-19]
MNTSKQSFGKNERIKSKKVISSLFDRNSAANSSFLIYPYKVIFSSVSVDLDKVLLPQVLISVSKKKFKNATDRNKIKRRTKEAYRQNKLLFGKNITLALIYVASEILDYRILEKSMKGVLARLEKETRHKASD